MQENELILSSPQMQFLSEASRYSLFCGGLGSGKTFAGAVWAIEMALKYPKTSGIITANSYSQLSKATLVMLFALLNQLGIPYVYRKNTGEIEIFGAKIYALSMEKYDLLRGIEAGWAWSDECAFYRKEAFDVLMGRIRDRKGPCQWKGTTTPNGYNWLYDVFVKDPLPSSSLITSRTTDNLENLSGEYVETLRSQYDSKMAQQELDGQFVNLTSGKVYYAFDRNQNVRPVTERNEVIYVGLDFNVDPLCGVFCFERDGKIHVTKELYLRDSNTFKAAKEITRLYPYHSLNVVCDETGNRRKTSSAQTDHEILRRAYLNVLKFSNPLQKDRYNNLNRLFERKLLVIDPSCTELISDLERLTYNFDDDMLGHITDALGYICWHLNPLKKPKRAANVKYR